MHTQIDKDHKNGANVERNFVVFQVEDPEYYVPKIHAQGHTLHVHTHTHTRCEHTCST
jgi:hypothetical protein